MNDIERPPITLNTISFHALTSLGERRGMTPDEIRIWMAGLVAAHKEKREKALGGKL